MSPSVLAAARSRARAGLDGMAEELRSAGMPVPEWTGRLIRPVMGLAAAGAADRPFWRAMAAVQLAHEASLLHDDAIDGATERRGAPTVAARRGVAAALVEGDHLLTSAYRMAADCGSPEWMSLFARAVERTVAGEKRQAGSAGRPLEWREYEEIVLGKSGELMGVALAAGPTLRGEKDARRYHEVGRRLGLMYQMLDDLLDYCAHVDTGKAALMDHRSGLWTWPRLYVDLPAGLEDHAIACWLQDPGAEGVTALARCVQRFRAEAEATRAMISDLVPDDTLLHALLREWVETAGAITTASPDVELPGVDGWESLMAVHARSFRFASRLFPADRRDQVTGVYAWCRYTDDLVDGVALPSAELEGRLNAWLGISRRAYEGEVTGNALADRVMTEMRLAGVPFGYAEELIEGMRMDVRGVKYGTVAELRRYTYRVASVVGLWMTELFGIRDPWMLDRAASLGHAMQLTNILRDVGEDLEAGRLYLPAAWLQAHGLTRDDLERMGASGRIEPAYAALVESLLQLAESEYDHAAPAIDRLPGWYGRPVAVAADVYRGIHDEIRGNGYDNLRRRAHTGLSTKIRLGTGALLRGGLGGAARRLTRASAALTLAALLGAAAATPAAGQTEGQSEPVAAPSTVAPMASTAWDRAVLGIGVLWVRAVDDADAVGDALALVAQTRDRFVPLPPARSRLLRAYEGSLITLRAKHGGWPRERLRDLRAGFALMDAAVDEMPDGADVRYVRLMSGFYLPAIFGRRAEVEADMAALIRLLPDARATFPSAVFPEVVRFVLDHGAPDDDARARLERLLP